MVLKKKEKERKKRKERKKKNTSVFNCSKFDVELHQDIQPLPLNQKIKTRNASLQL
jgi:hypothetical protein